VLNASIDGDNVVYRKDVNLGVAVALDWGLIVPVIHHADEKNVLGLARAAHDLAERARAKKLKVEEVQGGTFTVTNSRRLRQPLRHPDHQPAPGGDPRHRDHREAPGGPGRRHRHPHHVLHRADLRHRLVDGADADRFMAYVKKTLQEFDEAAL